jgi:hypothetical protein
VRWSGGQWCWLPSGQWNRVGNSCGLWFMRLLGRGLPYSRLVPKLPPLSGLRCIILPDMIGLFRLRAGMKSAMIILFCVSHPRSIAPVPSGCASPISIDGVLLTMLCLEGVVLQQFETAWFCFVWPHYPSTLPCLARFCTPGVATLPSMLQLVQYHDFHLS